MKFKENMSDIEKVSVMQRYILVHSCLYYELDSSIITDKAYDKTAYKLVEMQKGINVSDTDYGYAFHGFDGSTGFDLYGKLSDKDRKRIRDISVSVLRNYRGSLESLNKK